MQTARTSLSVRLRPLQAGFRVATFDGGGVLGIVSLDSLKATLAGLPLALPPCEYFDLLVGTSTGSIIAAALGFLRWSIARCEKSFNDTAKEVFPTSDSMFRSIERLLRLLWTGAKYPSGTFHQILKNIFHREPDPGCKVTRVAITAADFSAGLRLFRFHNAVPSTKSRYRPIWKAIATSCAAPLYFNPVGRLQDGGMAANNPSAVALQEVTRLSMIPSRMLDFAASFGTGQFCGSSPGGLLRVMRRLSPDWIQRLGKGVLGNLDPAVLYQRFEGQLSPEELSRHHRIDPVITRPRVALDDTNAISDLRRLRTGHDLYGDLRLSILATAFYAIVLASPSFDAEAGCYNVRIAVVSRWEDDDSTRWSLYGYLWSSSFLVQGVQRYRFATYFELKVMVPCLSTPIDISLQVKGSPARSISGLPLSVEQLSYLQGISYSRDWPVRCKRKRETFDTFNHHKRRCLEKGQADIL
ncbi:hypothetical protein NUU61_001616 [Penicillium alfredii]|uniref:PNPLA domain-containing protein n=1 Tax=Penicillium alfredii TaxID=1506179 RepID=A0A9W9G1E9_9EURO|nr:uncharacterized protein NUU61_001616 [Penicillium alfredii]KAJ5110359.1 hypothetical protein NUU61_001616 [Penicillium alfredii]